MGCGSLCAGMRWQVQCGPRPLVATRPQCHILCASQLSTSLGRSIVIIKVISPTSPPVEKCWQLLGFHLSFFFHFSIFRFYTFRVWVCLCLPLPCSLFNLNENLQHLHLTTMEPSGNGIVDAAATTSLQFNIVVRSPLAHTSSLARPPPLKALNPPHNPQPSIAPALEGRSLVVWVGGQVAGTKWVGFLLATGIWTTPGSAIGRGGF